MHDRFQRQLLGGQHRKSGAEVEAHLTAEDGQRAGAGAVLLFRAVRENPFEQVVILVHGWMSRAFGEPIGLASFNVRTDRSTAAIRPTGSLIPEKMSTRPANGKGGSRAARGSSRPLSPDQAGKAQTPAGQQHPERIKLGRGRHDRGANGDRGSDPGMVGSSRQNI